MTGMGPGGLGHQLVQPGGLPGRSRWVAQWPSLSLSYLIVSVFYLFLCFELVKILIRFVRS